MPAHRKIDDVDELISAVEAYFESRMASRMVFTGMHNGEKVYEREEYMKPPTVAGLALALDVDRRTLLRYLRGEGERDPELSPVLARAWMRIAEWWEEALAVREASNGARFALEVNFGYGKDDAPGETGGDFTMKTISPATDDTGVKAIPKWEPEE